MARTVNISAVIDGSKIGAFQTRLFVICAVCLLMDGFDMQAVGYVAPAIIQDWHIASYLLGPVFAAGNFGVLIGSLTLTVLADKIGRRPVLIGATVAFSLLTLVTAQAASVSQLLIFRFAAGLAFGCIMPNAVALVAEYSPQRMRVRMMSYVMVGFVSGAAAGGFVSAWLIPWFGWRSVFYFGGIAPLAIALLMYRFLPESLHFLVLRGKNPRQVGDLLRVMLPDIERDEHVVYTTGEQDAAGVPVVHLFRDGRTLSTVLLWIVTFMNLLDIFFLANWLPTVIREAGYSISNAVLVGTTLQVAGIVAVFVFASFAARFGTFAVLTIGFVIACVDIALIGPATASLAALFLVVLLAGLGIQGGQIGINALAATYYPTYMRSTGIGWALGIGRVGAIVGPFVGGELLRLHWTATSLFLAAAVPALISVGCMLWLWRAMVPEDRHLPVQVLERE
jgi:MFS transporter, AAHS family, 4-hydroxybenzoate transporter